MRDERRPGVIVQARTGSTRLPGKVLERVQGDTLLGHLLRRLARLESNCPVIVATTTLDRDAVLVDEALRHGASCFRGDEQDVLARTLGAARRYRVDPVIRVTSDCPLIDPTVIDAALGRWQAGQGDEPAVDVVTNTREGRRSYPRGLDVEVVSLRALERIDAALAAGAPQREHVTQGIYERAERFRIEDLLQPVSLAFLRWTVDTPEDLELIRRIYDALHPRRPEFDTADVLALLERQPELLALNARIRQKPLRGPVAS